MIWMVTEPAIPESVRDFGSIYLAIMPIEKVSGLTGF
jgi:hypothetical protein